jgi:H+/Cl- antiporter ClcA
MGDFRISSADYDISTAIDSQDNIFPSVSKSKISLSEILISIFIIFFFGLLFNLWYKLIFEFTFDHIQNRKKKNEIIALVTIVLTAIALIVIILVSNNILGKKTSEAVLTACGKKPKQ